MARSKKRKGRKARTQSDIHTNGLIDVPEPSLKMHFTLNDETRLVDRHLHHLRGRCIDFVRGADLDRDRADVTNLEPRSLTTLASSEERWDPTSTVRANWSTLGQAEQDPNYSNDDRRFGKHLLAGPSACPGSSSGSETGTFGSLDHTGLASPSNRTIPLTDPAGRSEDVVLFKGRACKSAKAAQTEKLKTSSELAAGHYGSQSSHATVLARPIIDQDKNHQLKLKRPESPKKLPKSRHALEDEALSDYIINLWEQDGRATSFCSESPAVGCLSPRSINRQQTASNEPFVQTLNQHFEHPIVSGQTSDAIRVLPGNIQIILARRVQLQVPQYLVVREGYDADDAQWVPLPLLKSAADLEHVNSFEATPFSSHSGLGLNNATNEELTALYNDAAAGTTVLGAVGLDVNGSPISDESIASTSERGSLRDKSMGEHDESTAQLFAKREGLGTNADDAGLLDESDESCGGSDITDSSEHFATRYSSAAGRKEQVRCDFPPARLVTGLNDRRSAFDFDLLDFDRRSLRKCSLAGRKVFTLELTDSELEESLKLQWDADRKKKRTKRQERETLRTQGLLGKGNKTKHHANKGFARGVSVTQLRAQIKQFLMSADDSLALPPMARDERKIVHEISHAFGLKSKSEGKNSARFPVLFKTKKTCHFDEAAFDAGAERIDKRFLTRSSNQNKKGSVGSRRFVGGCGAAAVSYKDGDVVGGAAPEIGFNNRGRLLLQKCGWNPGEGLGACGNKGILQPVAHVVKVSKTGLG